MTVIKTEAIADTEQRETSGMESDILRSPRRRHAAPCARQRERVARQRSRSDAAARGGVVER